MTKDAFTSCAVCYAKLLNKGILSEEEFKKLIVTSVEQCCDITAEGPLDTISVNKLNDYEHNIEKEKILATGISPLDLALGGFRPGEITLIIGSKFMGKTSLALNMIYNMLVYYKYKVLFFSGSEKKKDVLSRLYNIKPEEKKPYCDLLFSMIIDRPITSLSEIDTDIMSYEYKSDIVIIDDINLFKNTKYQYRCIDDIGRIKSLADKLMIPIVIFSGFVSDIEDRDDHRIKLQDVFNQIEAVNILDIDNIISIYRDDYYHEAGNGLTELCVLKNANGTIGTVELMWQSLAQAYKDGY